MQSLKLMESDEHDFLNFECDSNLDEFEEESTA
jgi:hypothetical protein